MPSSDREYQGAPVTGLATDQIHVLRLPGWEVVRLEEIPKGPVAEPLPPLEEEEDDGDWDVVSLEDGSEASCR
jgi:hypothetical protein